MYRKTYAKINCEQLKKNIKEIKNKYSDYEYYFGVVKNNAYHHGFRVVNDLIAGGVNYLCVSSLEEVFGVRKYNQEIPVLCLEPINLEFLDDCINQNITLTVESLDYIRKLIDSDIYSEIKVHIKVDSGMNRLGLKTKQDLNRAIDLLNKNKMIKIEGIYSHFATDGIADIHWDNQVESFLKITSDIDLKSIPIVHFGRSLTLVQHPKLDFCNGIRLGIIMFGHSMSIKPDNSLKGKLRSLRNKYRVKKNHISPTTVENDLNLKTVMSLYSEVMTIKKIAKDEFAGYAALYTAKDETYIATIPVGYADGVTKKFGFVIIKNKKYPIIADSCDMIMVSIDKSIKVGDAVEIFGDKINISEVSKKTGMSAYKIYNSIQFRLPRIYEEKGLKEEIYY